MDDLDLRKEEKDKTAIRYVGLSRAMAKLIVIKRLDNARVVC